MNEHDSRMIRIKTRIARTKLGGGLYNFVNRVNPKSLPGYDDKKYKYLLEHPISLVSETCWGGVLLHLLGLRFDTPFINTRVGLFRDDFFELLENIDCYMHRPPTVDAKDKWKGVDFQGWDTRTLYPILWYDDIMLHGFHYSSVEEFMECWERRRARFHFDNVVAVKILYDEKDKLRFEELPIQKKLGLASFESDNPNIITIPFQDYNLGKATRDYLHNKELFRMMDVFEFLIGGKDFKR